MTQYDIKWLIWLALLTVTEGSNLEDRVNANSIEIANLGPYLAHTDEIWDWIETNKGKLDLITRVESSPRDSRGTMAEMETKLVGNDIFMSSLADMLAVRLEAILYDKLREKILADLEENLNKKIDKAMNPIQIEVKSQANIIEELSNNQTRDFQALSNRRQFENNKDRKQIEDLYRISEGQAVEIKELTKDRERINEFNRTSEELVKMVNKRMGRFKRFSSQMTNLTRTVKKQDAIINQINVLQNNADTSISDLTSTLGNTKERVDSIIKKLSDAENYIETLTKERSDIISQKSRIFTLESQTRDLENRIRQFETTRTARGSIPGATWPRGPSDVGVATNPLTGESNPAIPWQPGQPIDTSAIYGNVRAPGRYGPLGGSEARRQNGWHNDETRNQPGNEPLNNEGIVIPGSGLVYDPSAPGYTAPLIPYNPGDPVPYMPFGNIGNREISGNWRGQGANTMISSPSGTQPHSWNPSGSNLPGQIGPTYNNPRGESAGPGAREYVTRSQGGGTRASSGGPGSRTGHTGVHGTPGVPGDTGLPGTDGSPGPQGYPGSRGSAGSRGSSGPQGYPGSRGSEGSRGSAGSHGSEGYPGSRGSRGSVGSRGSEGSPGPRGSAGSRGSEGSPGSRGSTGPNGSVGSRGSPGPRGPSG